MNTPKTSHSSVKKSKWMVKSLTQGVAAGAMLLTASCNPMNTIDPRGEFVENDDTINVTDGITNPLAIKFLKNMRDVINRTRTGGGPWEKQSFDNLYDYIQDEVRGIGEDIRVPVLMTPDIQIDTAVSPAGSTPYLNYSVTAEEKWEGNRHVIISWSANFTRNGKSMTDQLEFINYNDDNQVYMLDGSTNFWRIVNKSEMKKAIDDSIPQL
jgi:predicted small secreted protein